MEYPIEKYKTDLNEINQALTAKEVGEVDKFSEVAEKIRGIETATKYNVVVDFNTVLNYTHYISFIIQEENNNGKILLNISETIKTPNKTKYEYTFQTDCNEVYFSGAAYYDGGRGEADRLSQTLTDLKNHKTILIVAGNSKTNIKYSD